MGSLQGRLVVAPNRDRRIAQSANGRNLIAENRSRDAELRCQVSTAVDRMRKIATETVSTFGFVSIFLLTKPVSTVLCSSSWRQ